MRGWLRVGATKTIDLEFKNVDHDESFQLKGTILNLPVWESDGKQTELPVQLDIGD
jgi:hypothetical protein